MHRWSGKGSNVYRSTIRALNFCESYDCWSMEFDADGIGSAVRGDAADINEKRKAEGKREVACAPFRASDAVYDPDGSLVEGRLNRDSS